MAILKKNIWLLYYTIVAIGGLLALVISLNSWHEIYAQARDEQESLVKMATSSANAHIDQYKILFSTIDELLVRNDTYRKPNQARKLLSDLVKAMPSIADIGLFDMTGQQLLSAIHGAFSTAELVNISNSASFQEYLDSREMVIGRTFKNHESGKYYIPIANMLRDSQGYPLTLVVAAVETEDGFVFFNRNEKQIFGRQLSVTREKDDYLLSVAYDSKFQTNPYNKPLAAEVRNLFHKALWKKYGLTPQDVKESEMTVSFLISLPRFGTRTLTTSEYIQQYDLWITMHRPLYEIRSMFYAELLIIWGVFVVVIIVQYLLFREIDRSETKKRAALNYQANHDYLTKLHNRYYLSSIVPKLENSGRRFWVMLIDIRRFKRINEKHGHQFGDIVLREIANRLSKLAKADINIRHSGNEFIVISHQSEDEIIKLARVISVYLEQSYIVSGQQVSLDVSIGISQYPKDGNSFDAVKQSADLATCASKINRQQVTVFSQCIRDKYNSLHEMEQSLTRAIEEHQLYMVYQPQVDKHGTVIGVEALVRWEDEVLGFVPPDKFISVAENAGLMPRLGWYIIKQSLTEIHSVQQRTNCRFNTSINISALQFMEDGFCGTLLGLTKSLGVDTSTITLEITESLFIEDTQYLLDLITSLKQEGFKFSLDDFGTGYSSLSLLKKLPLDELKLDKSFIDDIISDIAAEKMVANIVNIGKELGMEIVAEGVEKLEQKTVLDKFGCNLYQGYYFAKPMKKECIIAYLNGLPQ